MRKPLTFFSVLLLVAVFAGSAWANGKSKNMGLVDQLRVMTFNLYIGADILSATEPRPCGALQAVHELFEDIVASNFPERAEAIVDLIERERPEAIALQEVYRISKQVPSDSFVYNPDTEEFEFANFTVNIKDPPLPPTITFIPNADIEVFDYLKLLLDALAARNLHYEVVEDAVAYESDFELPSWDLIEHPEFGCVPAPEAFPTDVRAEDRDVILVRSDVATANATAGNYGTLLPFPISTGPDTPAVEVIVVRGYGATDLTYRGRTYRFVNTHLEVDDQRDPLSPINLIQAAQAMELVGILASETKPLVVVGDFNSSPDPDDVTTAYEFITANGYEDVGSQFGWRPMNTCCQAADLMNLQSMLYKRVDLIFVRPSACTEFLPSPIRVKGDRQSDKTASGLWPSDHAGVAAKLKLKQRACKRCDHRWPWTGQHHCCNFH